jgi:hexosaminidase
MKAKSGYILLLLTLTLFAASSGSTEKRTRPTSGLPVIPMPSAAKRLPGSLEVKEVLNVTLMVRDHECAGMPLDLFKEKLKKQLGLEFEFVMPGWNETYNLPSEGYKLGVDSSVTIIADNPHGLHNALMTLFQLIDDSTEPPSIPACEIKDQPRFSWRGFMIDPARTFIPPDMVKEHIDFLSELKFNVFHWHLTDDQGWRIESEAYPKLHEVGSPLHYLNEKKKQALDDHGWGRDGRGYYTRDEVREIVEYAAERYIMVVPEIDVPGHTSAMLAAYPELSCDGEGAPVRTISGGIYPTALCPGKEEVYEFLDTLFAELIELFPSPYFHVGGDEVAASEIMAERGYTTRPELQGYFMERVNEILKKHGKTMIGWDEISRHAPEGVVIQAWRQHKYATQSAEKGHQTLVSLFRPHYLNYSPFQHTLKANYTFEPVPKNLAPENHHLIIGGEGCLWGRQPSIAEIEGRLFPRLMAQAEVLWSPGENRDWKDFLKRLEVAQRRMEKRGVEFGPGWRDLLDFHVIFTYNPEVNK